MAANGSQMSAMVPGSTSTLSMREKSHLKRRINREHNCNFRAGYIEVNEEYLHKTGIRGRKRFLLYCVVVTLIILALLNALVTAGLIYFLGISHLGIESLEFLPEKGLLRVMGEAEVHKMKMFDSRIGGRYEKDLVVSGMDGSVTGLFLWRRFDKYSLVFGLKKTREYLSNRRHKNKPIVLQAPYENGTRVVMYDKKISLTTDEFLVTSNKDGRVLFSTSDTVTQPFPLKQSRNLHAKSVKATTVRSRSHYPDLVLESLGMVKIIGTEGVKFNSRLGLEAVPATGHSIILNATAGSVNLDAGQGLFISNKLPVAPNLSLNASSTNGSQASSSSNQRRAYKLCVCMPSGKIFLVEVTEDGIGCNNAVNSADICS